MIEDVLELLDADPVLRFVVVAIVFCAVLTVDYYLAKKVD